MQLFCKLCGVHTAFAYFVNVLILIFLHWLVWICEVSWVTWIRLRLLSHTSLFWTVNSPVCSLESLQFKRSNQTVHDNLPQCGTQHSRPCIGQVIPRFLGDVADNWFRLLLQQSCIRQSIMLSCRDHIGWKSSKIISQLVSLECCSLHTATLRIYSKSNTPKWPTPLLIWAPETFDGKLRPNGKIVQWSQWRVYTVSQ